jgi:hypothetical protein
MHVSGRNRIYVALTVAAIVCGVRIARGDDAQNNQQLQQKVDQLEAKVQALETQQQNNDSNTMQAIQSNADQNSKFMASDVGNIAAGYDPNIGFYLSSDDGNFMLNPWLLGQFRGDINDRQGVREFSNGDTGGGTAHPVLGSHETDGFEVHNLMIGLDGHLGGPNLQYFFMIDVPSSGGGVTLQDAYATYRFNNDCPWIVKAGQYVDPIWHESNVDDAHQAMVDRSLAGAILGGNNGLNNIAERVQGVALQYQNQCMHDEVDLTDGKNTANTPFYDVPAVTGFPAQNFGIGGRVDMKIKGDQTAWDAYNSLSSLNAKTDAAFVGGGFEWAEASNLDNIYLTLDGSYISKCGLSVYGAFLLQYNDWSDNNDSQSALERDVAGSYPNYGFIIQAAYRIKPQVEVFARYDVAVLDSRYANILAFGNKNPGGNAGATANNNELTAGVNYYIYGYNAKISGDIGFLPSGSTVDAPGLGILANQNHTEWVGRVQFQLAI